MDGSNDVQDAANMRALVRAGYDTISRRYRSDDGTSHPATAEITNWYAQWIGELAAVVGPPAHVLDLGCGAGVPVV